MSFEDYFKDDEGKSDYVFPVILFILLALCVYAGMIELQSLARDADPIKNARCIELGYDKYDYKKSVEYGVDLCKKIVPIDKFDDSDPNFHHVGKIPLNKQGKKITLNELNAYYETI